MQPSSSQSLSRSKQATLLLVEDHDDYRQLVTKALNTFLPGWQVLEGCSVASALDVFQTSVIDVMVCDLNLPDGVAFDVLDRLSPASREMTKVIIFSNHSTEQLKGIPERTDIHGYITKERGLKELAQLIERVAGLEASHLDCGGASARPTHQA